MKTLRKFEGLPVFTSSNRDGVIVPDFKLPATVMKVMIVDDNAQMRGLIRTLLEGVASEFVECADGREAVDVFGAEHPDWAVMDVAMKEMDGLTATRLITSRFPGSHIMVITQHDHPKLHDRAREAGAEGFLLKENLLELPALLVVGPQGPGCSGDGTAAP